MSMDVARRIKESLCYTASDIVKVLLWIPTVNALVAQG